VLPCSNFLCEFNISILSKVLLHKYQMYCLCLVLFDEPGETAVGIT
jgi:hypothetical protein